MCGYHAGKLLEEDFSFEHKLLEKIKRPENLFRPRKILFFFFMPFNFIFQVAIVMQEIQLNPGTVREKNNRCHQSMEGVAS